MKQKRMLLNLADRRTDITKETEVTLSPNVTLSLPKTGPLEYLEISVILPRQLLDWVHFKSISIMMLASISTRAYHSWHFLLQGRKNDFSSGAFFAKATHKTWVYYRHPVRKLHTSVLTILLFSALTEVMISRRKMTLINSGLEGLHSTLQFKVWTAAN